MQGGAVSANGANNGGIGDIGLTVFADELGERALRSGLFRSDEMSLHVGNIRSMKQPVQSTNVPSNLLI
jgi:hypothetical protein